MCGGVHYGEVEGLVSVERWSCCRGTTAQYTTGVFGNLSLGRLYFTLSGIPHHKEYQWETNHT